MTEALPPPNRDALASAMLASVMRSTSRALELSALLHKATEGMRPGWHECAASRAIVAARLRAIRVERLGSQLAHTLALLDALEDLDALREEES